MVVREVATTRDRDRFIRFPWTLYRNDACWVPPLISECRVFLDPARNPFFEHAEAKLFLAVDPAGAVRGRIAAVVNRRHIEIHGEKTGFFGLFECVNDHAVAAALFDAAAGFLRSRGLTVMRGPENLSINDDLGLLIEGFDSPPAIMMPHNPPYYAALIEARGFRKAMDLLAYYEDIGPTSIPDSVKLGIERCRERYQFRIRQVNMSRFEEDLRTIHSLYSRAWERNWGAIAMTEKEFAHLAAQLKPAVDPDFCLIAEVGGETAGFSLALPDFNQVLIKLNGRLFPFGFLKALWYRRHIDRLRVITLGTLRKFRHMGIDSCFYYENWKRALAKGMTRAEMSWILETNAPMNNALTKLGYRVYKRYRLYDLNLAGED